jgi:hypothetical protein
MAVTAAHIYGANGANGKAMPAETTAKPKRETWLDLMPPEQRPARDDLITRDELIAELKDRGLDMTAVALAAQERRGFLPRALRSRRGGSPVALYPPQAVDWIAYARQLQEGGTPLRQVGPVIRVHVLLSTGHGRIDTTPGIGEVMNTLESALAALVTWHIRTHDTVPVAKVEARLLDSDDNVIACYPFDKTNLVLS